MSSRSQTSNAGQPLQESSLDTGRIEELTVLVAVGAFSVLALVIYFATFVVVLKG